VKLLAIPPANVRDSWPVVMEHRRSLALEKLPAKVAVAFASWVERCLVWEEISSVREKPSG